MKYIKIKDLKIASVYGDIVYSNGKLITTGLKRTGCMFCLLGIEHDKSPNRIQRLAVTHPNIYKYIITQLGFDKVMDFLKVPYRQEIDIFNYNDKNDKA